MHVKLARAGTVRVICVLACALVLSPSLATGTEPQITINATEGKPFNGQVADIPSQSLACPVQDLSHEEASIVWGDDPTTEGTVSIDQAGTGLSVSGTHTYLAAGTYEGSVKLDYQCNQVQFSKTVAFTADVKAPSQEPPPTKTTPTTPTPTTPTTTTPPPTPTQTTPLPIPPPAPVVKAGLQRGVTDSRTCSAGRLGLGPAGHERDELQLEHHRRSPP